MKMDVDINRVEKRFWSNTDKLDNGCIQWKKSLTNGYGRFGINNKKIAAHRFSYMMFVGSIMPNMVIHHTCENKACVNPDHLREVSVSDNTRAYYNGDGW